MKRFVLLLAVFIVVGCDRAPEPAAPAADAPAPAAVEPAPPATPPPAPAQTRRATATGVVESIDTTARTITVAHGPVDALGWPGMTMAFQAPNTDLSTLKAGDNVRFEFDSSGMDGTIVSITRQ